MWVLAPQTCPWTLRCDLGWPVLSHLCTWMLAVCLMLESHVFWGKTSPSPGLCEGPTPFSCFPVDLDGGRCLEASARRPWGGGTRPGQGQRGSLGAAAATVLWEQTRSLALA